MEAIIGVEYSCDANGDLIADSKGRIGVKSIHPFLNFKFAKDWIKKSAFDMAGDDGNTVIDLDGKMGFAYDKNGKCIGEWKVFNNINSIHPYFLVK